MRSHAYHSRVDVRMLRCFVAVAEELHFGRAAARLHIAGPAVSQTIRSIENELGMKVFDRTNRRVELTDAGRVLLVEARAVLDRFDTAMATMARLRSGETGSVRIGAVAALPPRLVPELLQQCGAAAPGIDVVVTALRAGVGLRQALESDVDIALVRGEVAEAGIESVVIAREPVGVALPCAHALAAQPNIRPADLGRVPLISFPRASDPAEYERIFGALAASGLAEPRVVHESHPGAVESSLRLVARGVGLSLKLRSEVDAFGGDEVVWRPLVEVDVDVVISAAWRPGFSAPAIRRVLPLLTRRDHAVTVGPDHDEPAGVRSAPDADP
jgi:DNA-binding transcriptional LysR family regulator